MPFKPFAQEATEPHHPMPATLDLEHCVEELFSVASSRSTTPHELVEDLIGGDWLSLDCSLEV